MSSDELLQQSKELKLHPNQIANVRIGRLPKGKYVYRASLRNPSACVSQLNVQVKDGTSSLFEKTFAVKAIAERIEFSFYSSNHEALYALSFSLSGADALFLYLPVSAQKVQEIQNTEPALGGLDEQILIRMHSIEHYSSKTRVEQRPKSPLESNNSQMNLNEIESFINSRYFRGFLSMEEAEHQLDHVVLHKLFQPDGTRGLNRYKRAFYRKIIVGIYRMLTKNRARKVYFSKLYRNYVNNNLISENFHQY